MDGAPYDNDGKVRLAFATWVAQLMHLGRAPDDAAVKAACAKIDKATEAKVGEAAAKSFVKLVSDRLGDSTEPAAVLEVARRLYGDRVGSDLGVGPRADRTSRIRRHQFLNTTPWLVRIQERHADGKVGPSWLVVEQLTDLVRAMDPNPWNDIDERRHIPLADFHVLWELDGCGSVYVK